MLVVNIKDIRYRTFSTMVETLIVAGVVNDSIIRCTGQPKSSRTSSIKIDRIFASQDSDQMRQFRDIFPSLVRATALRGCLVRIKSFSHKLQSQ